MTEEETIRRLKKVSFEKMRDVLIRVKVHAVKNRLETSSWANLRDIAARQRGWTVREWQKENHRRIKLNELP